MREELKVENGGPGLPGEQVIRPAAPTAEDRPAALQPGDRPRAPAPVPSDRRG